MQKILNLGSGKQLVRYPNAEVINVDANSEFKPDIVCNITAESLPLDDGSIDRIWMFHMIEHITKVCRPNVMLECNRVLKSGGEIFITYPEFEKCAKNFLDNLGGLREFWEATLYGRQSHGFDFHVVPMVSELFKHELIDYGFGKFDIKPEESENYNTILKATKLRDVVTREEVVARELFNVVPR